MFQLRTFEIVDPLALTIFMIIVLRFFVRQQTMIVPGTGKEESFLLELLSVETLSPVGLSGYGEEYACVGVPTLH